MAEYKKGRQRKLIFLVILLSFVPVIIVIVQNIVWMKDAGATVVNINYVHESFNFTLKVANIMDKIQTERHLTLVYLATTSSQGRNLVERTLKNAYNATNKAFGTIKFHEWIRGSEEFRSQNDLNAYIKQHRRNVQPNSPRKGELKFYNDINERLSSWVSGQLKLVSHTSTWATITSFILLTEGKEMTSRANTLGTIHFMTGSLNVENHKDFIKTNTLANFFLQNTFPASSEMEDAYRDYTLTKDYKRKTNLEAEVLRRDAVQDMPGKVKEWNRLQKQYMELLSEMSDDLHEKLEKKLKAEKFQQSRVIGAGVAVMVLSLICWFIVVVLVRAYEHVAVKAQMKTMMKSATAKMFAMAGMAASIK